LAKVREEALLNKRKAELISKALEVAEAKGRNIKDMLESKTVKRDFEDKFTQNPFNLQYGSS
jgi:hypothetical protein